MVSPLTCSRQPQCELVKVSGRQGGEVLQEQPHLETNAHCVPVGRRIHMNVAIEEGKLEEVKEDTADVGGADMLQW